MLAVDASGPFESAVTRVQQWCRDRVPDHVRHQLRVECEVAGRDVTIVEGRPPWRPAAGEEWMRTPVARLLDLTSRGVRTLYRRDGDERRHPYREVPPAQDVDDLLEELERDPTAIFWG
jgi:hypothetical protein